MTEIDESVEIKETEEVTAADEIEESTELEVTESESEDITAIAETEETSQNIEMTSAVEEEVVLDEDVESNFEAMGKPDGAQNFGENDSLWWKYDEETKTLSIGLDVSSSNGQVLNTEIPDFDYNTQPWKDYKNSVQKIIVESGVSRIGNNAFSDYQRVTSITLPSTIKSIGDSAFWDCHFTEDVQLPEVVSVGYRAFSGTEMKNIALPKAEIVGRVAFSNCSELENVSLPKAVSVTDEMFKGCNNLKTVDIQNATAIGNSAFYELSSLESVNMPKVETIGEYAFESCKIKTIDMPNVKTIQKCAFRYSDIESITLPKVETIKNEAFYRCPNLQSADMPNVKTIEYSAFNDCPNLQSATMPNVESLSYAFQRTGLTSVLLPKSLKTVNNYVFDGCNEIEEYTIFCDETAFKNNATFGGGVGNVKKITFGCQWDQTVKPLNHLFGSQGYVADSAVAGITKKFIHISLTDEYMFKETEREDTISYKCCEECEGVEMQLQQTQQLVYNGECIDVGYNIIERNSSIEDAPENPGGFPKIKYYKDGYEVPEIIDAGDYEVRLITDKTDLYAKKNFTIQKATPTVDMFEFNAPEDLIYDGNAKHATIKVKDGIKGMGAVELSYSKIDSDNTADPIDAGTYKVSINIREGDNYERGYFTSDDWTFTIEKAESPARAVANKLTYTGSPQSLVSISYDTQEAYTVQYSFDNENWLDEIPQATDAGTYTVYYKIGATSNYNEKTGSVVVGIVKNFSNRYDIYREYPYAADNSDSIDLTEILPADYGTANFTVESSEAIFGFKQRPTVTDGILSYETARGSINDEGTITLVAELQNYEDITIVVHFKLVDQKPVKIKEGSAVALENNSLYYGQFLYYLSFKEAAFEDYNGNDVPGTLGWKNDRLEITETGTVGAEWVFTPDNEYYKPLEGTVTVIVNRLIPEVKDRPDVTEITFNPETTLADIELLDGEVTGIGRDEIDGTWRWKNTEIIPVANNNGYTAVFTPEDYDIYETIEVLVRVPVNQAQAYVYVDDNRKSYVKTFADEDFSLEGITYTGYGRLTYTVSDGKAADGTDKEADSIITVSEDGVVSIHGTGSAKVNVSTTVTSNYLAAQPQVIQVEVTKLEIPVEIVPNTLTYTGGPQKLVSLNGELPEGCTVEYKTDNTEWSADIPEATAAGTYTVDYKINGNNNYESKAGSVTAVISKTAYNKLEISKEYPAESDSEDTVNLSEVLPADCGTVTYETPVTAGNVTYTNAPVVADGSLSYTVAAGEADSTGTITVVVETQNYEKFIIVVNVKLTEHKQTENTDTPDKSAASITIEESRQAYTKIISAEDFRLEGITYQGDGRLTYTVAEGVAFNGETVVPESIITVSEDGVVSIHGAGSAKIYVGSTETDKYSAAEPQVIQVNVTLGDEFYVEGGKIYNYTGKAVKPELMVFDGLNGNQLINKKDYTVSYKNNTKAYTLKEGDTGFDAKKAPQAIIKGKGRYSSKITVYFTILPKDISQNEGIVIKDILLEEKGNVQKSVPAITYNGKKLAGVLKPENGNLPAKTKDFIYSYTDISEGAYTNAGTWKILVEGTGNYIGSRYVDIIIAAKGGKMSSAKIAKIPQQEYSGVPVELSKETLVVTAKVNGVKTTLEQDVHYSVSYKNNNAVGTATVTITGKPESGFSGSKSATFKIVETSIAKASIEGIEDKTFNGAAQTQNITVTPAGATEPLSNENYIVTYENNVNAGTAKVIITGTGTYSGTIIKTFKIKPYDMTGETDAAGAVKENSLLTEANGLFAMKDGDLSVKFVKGGVKPEVRLVFNGQALTEGRDFSVAYKNNKKVYISKEGDADYNSKKAPVITITGKGNFKGKASKTFVITARTLQEEGMAVSMTVSDKYVSSKKGGYISKPVLTDADGKVLKQGRDYTAPVYTITNENGEVSTLSNTDTVQKAGTIVTVTVNGLGTYAGAAENESVLSATYRIAANDFTKAKTGKITKPYTGSLVTLTKEDFYSTNTLGEKVSIVTMGSGSKAVQLHYGTDFEIVEGTYKKNIEKGTASVTIRGIGEYGGTKTIKFKIGTREIDDWFWWMDLLMAK